MAAANPVVFTRGMRLNGTTTGTAAEIQAGPLAPEVCQIHLPGWWLKWRRPKANPGMTTCQDRSSIKMIAGTLAKMMIRIGRDAPIQAAAAEFRIQKAKVRTEGPETAIAEMMIATDLGKDTADAIPTGVIVPGIVTVTDAAAEVEAGIGGARTEATTSDPAAVMTAVSAAAVAVAPLLFRLLRPAAVSALLPSDSRWCAVPRIPLLKCSSK